MTPLHHIVEPEGLMLTWQPSDEQASERTRRVVAAITKQPNGEVWFRYLFDSSDYRAAVAAGFKGHPAFDMKVGETRNGVIEAFLRRLPSRKREDFADFLALHRLPSPFNYSDIALLGYTGARLPSDGFAIVPVFERGVAPCDYVLEIAGFRHEPGANVSNLSIGDVVTFEVELDNRVDPGAIAILHFGKRIGYVNRALKDTFTNWMAMRFVTAKIERINGKSERPLIYLRVEIAC